MDKRQENIDKLENLSQKVLKLKNLNRKRRPILIKFCVIQKEGKTY